jgi:signal transduction histidine kinase
LSDIDVLKRLSEVLAKSKEFMEDIVATVREPLVVLDGDLKILYVSDSFFKTFRVNRKETEGELLYHLGNGQWDIPNSRCLLEEVISKDADVVDFEVNHEFPSLGPKTMLLNARKIQDGHSGEPIMLLAIEDISERKRSDERLKQAHDHLESMVEQRSAAIRQLSLKLLTVQDEEHRSIARDLHDSVGQHLVGIKMQVGRLRSVESTEQQTALLSQIFQSLDECMNEARTISYLLHPPMIDELGFRAAAKWYIEGFSERSGISVNFESARDPRRLPRAVELPLFRVLQAGLSNVHRHADTKSVDVLFEIVNGHAKLQIKDYGRGMDRDTLERFNLTGAGSGVGLQGMRERMRELGGRLEVESDDGGTIVRAIIPVPSSVNAKKVG